MIIDNYKLKFNHTVFEQPTQIHSLTYPVKGITKVTILDSNNNFISMGDAFCSSEDNFDKNEGRKRALKRAILKAFPNRSESLQERLKIWEGYRTSTKEPRWVN